MSSTVATGLFVDELSDKLSGKADNTDDFMKWFNVAFSIAGVGLGNIPVVVSLHITSAISTGV